MEVVGATDVSVQGDEWKPALASYASEQCDYHGSEQS